MRIEFKKGDAVATICNGRQLLGAVDIQCNDKLLTSLLENNINKNLVFTGDVFPETERDFYSIEEGKLPQKQTHTDKYLLHLAAKLEKLGYESKIIKQ